MKKNILLLMPLMAASFLASCGSKPTPADAYTITWKNWDESTLATETYNKDETPTYKGETPTRPEDELFTYTFRGWDPAIVPVVGDATYTATYKATPKLDDTYVTISIPEGAESKIFAFNCTAKGDVSVDWGDGATTTNKYFHEYTHSGDYIVIIKNITSLFFYDDDYPAPGFYFVTGMYLGKDITTIPDDACSGCFLLTDVYIRPGITTIGKSAFSACVSLLSIDIPEGVTMVGDDAFAYCMSLASIYIPASVEWFGSNVFDTCIAVNRIVIHEDNPIIDSRNDCNAIITKVDIEDEYGEKILKDTLLFGCMSTVIPNTVKEISSFSFANNIYLTSIKIPASVVNIGPRAFRGCSNVASIEVDEANQYYYSGNANAIITKQAIDEIPKGALIHGCMNTIIPDSVTSIYNHAFFNNIALKKITIPKNVATIREDAFSGCTSLESVKFASDSSLETIEAHAFYECTSLVSVAIPKSVTSIESSAFADCEALTLVDLTAFTTPNVDAIPIISTTTFDNIVIFKVANEAMCNTFKNSDKNWPTDSSRYTWDK